MYNVQHSRLGTEDMYTVPTVFPMHMCLYPEVDAYLSFTSSSLYLSSNAFSVDVAVATLPNVIQ